MGIRLDWEIEAEKIEVRQAGEDPVTKRRRRLARLRLLGVVLGVLALIALVVAGVVWRLQSIEAQIEQVLRNTVEAEVTALRLGDWAAFSTAQRSASPDWLVVQEQRFNEYQTLKLQQDVQLTGHIRDITIDKTRARVEIEEIVNGVPYTRVWFYWQYDDGWRHVPPDYTFWGELGAYSGAGVTVRYRSVDAALATEMGQQVEGWINTACAALVCDSQPEVQIDIVPDDGLQLGWSQNNPWLLQVPSPYTQVARSDVPFEGSLKIGTARLLAERLVSVRSGDVQPNAATDAFYLRQAVVTWLVGRFVQLDTGAFLVDSLAQRYGPAKVGDLLQQLQPGSDVRVLNVVTGAASLEQTNLDWRDYLTWRVRLEDELILRRDDAGFLALYDTRDDVTRSLAYQRYATTPQNEEKMVGSAALEQGADGQPVLRAGLRIGTGETARVEEILFRLADGIWRRAN